MSLITKQKGQKIIFHQKKKKEKNIIVGTRRGISAGS